VEWVKLLLGEINQTTSSETPASALLKSILMNSEVHVEVALRMALIHDMHIIAIIVNIAIIAMSLNIGVLLSLRGVGNPERKFLVISETKGVLDGVLGGSLFARGFGVRWVGGGFDEPCKFLELSMAKFLKFLLRKFTFEFHRLIFLQWSEGHRFIRILTLNLLILIVVIMITFLHSFLEESVSRVPASIAKTVNNPPLTGVASRMEAFINPEIPAFLGIFANNTCQVIVIQVQLI
jgi:hypothetical protein